MTAVPRLRAIIKRKAKPRKVSHQRQLHFPVDQMLVRNSVLQRMKRVMEEKA